MAVASGPACQHATDDHPALLPSHCDLYQLPLDDQLKSLKEHAGLFSGGERFKKPNFHVGLLRAPLASLTVASKKQNSIIHLTVGRFLWDAVSEPKVRVFGHGPVFLSFYTTF